MSGELTLKQPRAIAWTPDAAEANAEAELIQRCAVGDEQACAELLSEHQRMVFQLALHLLGDHEEALDLSQEVFLRVFRTIARFRGQSALRTWIYRIVINQARNRQRWWNRRRRGSQVSLDDHVLQHGELTDPGGRTAPDGVLQQKELATRVWSALDQLPFDQRTAVILREIEGLSYEEIAFSLGINIGTVKSRLTRARGALRLQLSGARELGDL
ncbi:MAG: sigma-70 family RNA polymerase sigma factor [Acidobacteria bacterium]|nr:sigma-70 family RNA polymerase sigma factor [Acidobacteriota bacterium]